MGLVRKSITNTDVEAQAYQVSIAISTALVNKTVGFGPALEGGIINLIQSKRMPFLI